MPDSNVTVIVTCPHCQETYTTTIYSSMYCRCLCEKCGLKLETYKRKDNENNNQKAAI